MKKIFILFLFISITSCLNTTQEKSNLKEINDAKIIAEKFLTAHNIPGMAISVSKHGHLIWSQGFGYTNLKLELKTSPNSSQFRIASISKPITGFALGLLIDAAKLNLDESIYTYIPDYPKKEYDFTVRQVGGHIAGIRTYKGNEFLMNTKMSIVEGLDIFKNDSLEFKPRTQYMYSTYGWNLLSVVIQNAAKTEFNTYMKTHVFNPLQMNATTLELSDAVMHNKTEFYRKTKSGEIIIAPKVSNEHKAAGGGFLSTSEDLIKFGNEIITPTILSQESLSELLKPQILSTGKSTDYGVGFSINKTKNGTNIYSHSGGGVGATTLLLMYPEEGIVITIITNISQIPIKDLGKSLEDVFVN